MWVIVFCKGQSSRVYAHTCLPIYFKCFYDCQSSSIVERDFRPSWNQPMKIRFQSLIVKHPSTMIAKSNEDLKCSGPGARNFASRLFPASNERARPCPHYAGAI